MQSVACPNFQTLEIGDRIQTSSGRVGAIATPPWPMPHHYLVQFEDGPLRWVVREAVQPWSGVGKTVGKTGRSRGQKGAKLSQVSPEIG